MNDQKIKLAVIIPAYKIIEHIVELVEKIGPEIDKIYIVDDCCPNKSGKFVEANISDERIVSLYNDVNLGVGGAVLNGMIAAKEDGMHIGIKIDGDGQMDPRIVGKFIQPILSGNADYTKGNRFFNPQNVAAMPLGRVVGNSILSFVSKFSTGYWNIFDPTNGYVAINLKILNYLQIEKINKRYFFETDMLFRCNLIRAKVVDIPMVAIYEDELSNLKFSKEAFRFMKGHTENFMKRIGYNYFLRDFNIASLELLSGLVLVLFSTIYGLSHFGGETPDSAGTVMLAAVPFMMGFLLLLSFLNYDIQQTPKDAISKHLNE